MAKITTDDLTRVISFPRLVDLLRDKLEWPIPEDFGLEDVTFEYEPAELGLKAEEAAKLREIYQLRPLVTGQPWGVFFLSFENKAMSVTVLRRILRALVVKQRGSSSAERAAWDRHDLIFAANFGKSGDRELAFVHFNDGASTGDLPVMKVLGWNRKDTTLHNQHAANMLASKLTWPDDTSDVARWRDQWASAFGLGYGQVIRTSKDLAARLAALAGDIRARANELLDAEVETGPMRTMLDAFRKNLIHDLDEDGFADMFAQTICYGLLAAAMSRIDDEGRSVITADNLADMVPRTNPFLRELFATFLHIGGRDKRSGLNFDELGVADVVTMLSGANTDMGAVLRDFGNRNPRKDPVIHFYEDFLREYDKDQKVDAGIFYTPPAVVGFIVRGVDEMLRTEFGLKLGLADTSTWEEVERSGKVKRPAHVDPKAPFIQILDPATGTGTFMVEVIDLIHKRMVETWKVEGKSAAQIREAWNAYVPQHLLPRLTAFELKMAAYAIAHMKIGLKLSETGYSFGSDERLHVLLTNTLQPPRPLDLDEMARQVAFAHEAERANHAKEKVPFTVVIGNPPYKGESMNPSKVGNKLTFAGEIIQRFKQVRGTPLGERNPKWLNNDYVKFIAFAMLQIERSGVGVLGYITSNSWLDSPTFRGVRTGVMDCFPVLRILDLHGNVNKGEQAADGTRDEGVFAIEEGTNITIGGKLSAESTVRQGDLLGKVGDGTGDGGKLDWLEHHRLADAATVLTPLPPIFRLTPMTTTVAGENPLQAEFYGFKGLPAIQPTNSAGIVTANDDLCVQFNAAEMTSTAREFLSVDLKPLLAERDLRGGPAQWKLEASANPVKVAVFKKKEPRDWQVKFAQDDLRSRKALEQDIKPIAYRPFDIRSTVYTGQTRGFQCMPRSEVMEQMLIDGNLACVTTRQRTQATGAWANLFVAPGLSEGTYISNKTGEINYAFPLWLKPANKEKNRRPNIDPTWARDVATAIQLVYEDGIPKGEQGTLGKEFVKPRAEQLGMLDTPWDGRGDLARNLGPRDLFDYIYAVLHSPTYRSRYAEFLKSDFPRIPTPASRALFADLVPLGRKLIALHLLKPEVAPQLENPDIRFTGQGEARVEKGYPQYENGKVKINATHWFEDVPKSTWEFHIGGYQPCDKWLKDRAAKGDPKKDNHRPGRILTAEDILHYRRMVTAMTETRILMGEIDVAITKHGGWPGAFRGMTDDCA